MSLPVDKALRKAQSHIKVGELAEAEELYKQIPVSYTHLTLPTTPYV